MTKKTFILIGVIILCITFIVLDRLFTQAKIERFCETRDMPEEECYCIIDYFKKNAPKDIRNEFMEMITEKQELPAHPSLVLPALGALIYCENNLKK